MLFISCKYEATRHCCSVIAILKPSVQTSIRAEGFRSLRESEQVEYDLERGEDGRGKAINVTGPHGAPPQVLQLT